MSQFLFQHKISLILLFLLVAALTYVLLQTPSNSRDWNSMQTVVPTIQITDTRFTVEGVRDFRYDDAAVVTQSHYVNATHEFADLKQVWYGISHFGPYGLAHAFLSFEFNDDEYLVLSIEARLEKNELYSPWKGMFRRYEKLFIFGTEPDIIGLRSKSRDERVLLYPIMLENAESIKLLKDYLVEANHLESTPEFYNTLVDNCLTGILKSSGYFSTWDFLTNIHILLPGRSDALAQDLGLLDKHIDLAELQRRAQVDPANSDPNSESFSKEIRAGWDKH